MEKDTTTANWMEKFPDPTEEQKRENHIRFLEECVTDLEGILNKMYHGVQLTHSEQAAVRRVVEDMHRQTEEELFAARGGEIIP